MLRDKNLKLKQKFLEYYSELPVQKLAAGYIGKNEDTITDWKHSDSDFSDQIDLARSNWAMKRTKRVKSEEWLLERVIKDHFAPPKSEVDLRVKELPKPLLTNLDVHNNDRLTETKAIKAEN